jgi:alpha-tubulin suppressor-like RCC1 family protein
VAVEDAVAVSFAGFAGCAVRCDGALFCWGTNGGLKFGVDLPSRTGTPVESLVRDLHVVRLGLEHACGIGRDGFVRCWGNNLFGALGRDGWNTDAARVTGLPRVHSLAVGSQHSCAVTVDHDVFCWGRNDKHQLGDASSAPSEARAIPVAL